MRDRDFNRAKRLKHLSARCRFYMSLLIMISLAAGCGHYPVNETLREYNANAGYRGKLMRVPGKSDEHAHVCHLLRRGDAGCCIIIRRA